MGMQSLVNKQISVLVYKVAKDVTVIWILAFVTVLENWSKKSDIMSIHVLPNEHISETLNSKVGHSHSMTWHWDLYYQC
jgi:hypothetical protein